MATSELSIINAQDVSYEFSSSFDGERFFIVLNYNDRNDTWYLDVKNANLDVLLSGLPCLTNVEGLTTRFKLPDVFPFGDLVIADTNDTGVDPTFENFGDEISGFYSSIIDG